MVAVEQLCVSIAIYTGMIVIAQQSYVLQISQFNNILSA